MKPEYLLFGFTVCELCSQWHSTVALDLGDFIHVDDENGLQTFPRFQKTLFEKYGLGKLYRLLIERVHDPQPRVRRSEILPKLKFLANRIEILLNVTSYMDFDNKVSILPSLSVLVHILRPEFTKIKLKIKILKNKGKFLKQNVNTIVFLSAKIDDALTKLESDVQLCRKRANGNTDKS